MTQLQDRLQAAFEARAAEIPAVAPPLKLQPSRRKSGSAARRGGGRSWRRSARWWLPPLVAALAVVAVIVGVLVAGGNLPGQWKPPALPAVNAPIQTSVPPYYVAIASDRPLSQYGYPASVATVRDTATGRILATVRPPAPYTGFSQVSGATDDRTFVLLADTRRAAFGAIHERFYLLRIDLSAPDAARRASMTALPASFISGSNVVGTMALSPDGRALASVQAVYPPTGSSTGLSALSVSYLATGTTRTWIRYVCSHHNCQQQEIAPQLPSDANPQTLSWAQNGKSLAFAPDPITQLRVLDLHAPGSNAQARSSPFPITGVPVSEWNSAVMTPDTRSAFINYAGLHGHTVFGGLLRYSAKTGRIITLSSLTFRASENGTQPYEPAGSPIWDDVIWTSYNGSQAVVLNARPGLTAGIYTGTHYTPLPWPANVFAAAW